MPVLRTVGWVACVVYSTIPLFWILIHSRVNHWRSRTHSPYLVLLPLWMGIWFAFGLLTWRWRQALLYSTPWTWLPAAVLFACGFRLYSQAAKNFSGRQLGGVPEISPGSQGGVLVTSGIRARVRHPVYLAHLCELFAWSLGTGLAVAYGLTMFAVVTGAVMIRMEERELEERFGDEYRRYCNAVPAIVLRIF